MGVSFSSLLRLRTGSLFPASQVLASLRDGCSWGLCHARVLLLAARGSCILLCGVGPPSPFAGRWVASGLPEPHVPRCVGAVLPQHGISLLPARYGGALSWEGRYVRAVREGILVNVKHFCYVLGAAAGPQVKRVPRVALGEPGEAEHRLREAMSAASPRTAVCSGCPCCVALIVRFLI